LFYINQGKFYLDIEKNDYLGLENYLRFIVLNKGLKTVRFFQTKPFTNKEIELIFKFLSNQLHVINLHIIGNPSDLFLEMASSSKSQLIFVKTDITKTLIPIKKALRVFMNLRELELNFKEPLVFENIFSEINDSIIKLTLIFESTTSNSVLIIENCIRMLQNLEHFTLSCKSGDSFYLFEKLKKELFTDYMKCLSKISFIGYNFSNHDLFYLNNKLKKVTSLRHLEFDFSYIVNTPEMVGVLIDSIDNLESLVLKNQNLTNVYKKIFKPLKKKPLKNLVMDNCNLLNCFPKLAKLVKLTECEELNLSRNSIAVINDLECINDLIGKESKITTLNLSNCNIQQIHFNTFFNILLYNTSLKVLDISNNNSLNCETFIILLLAIKQHPSLEELKLLGINFVSNESNIIAISNSLNFNKKIERIYVNYQYKSSNYYNLKRLIDKRIILNRSD